MKSSGSRFVHTFNIAACYDDNPNLIPQIGNLIFFCLISYSSNFKYMLNQRDYNTTLTLFLVCFFYFLFVTPMLVFQTFTIEMEFDDLDPMVYLGVYCLYWFQYSVNFIIYIVRGEQYRRAYIFFLCSIKENLYSLLKPC